MEFKTSLAERDEGIRTLAAFANAQGGTVIFGVKPTGRVSGVDVGANTLENLANRIRDHTDPHLHPSIEELVIDGRTVIAVTVLKAAKGTVVYAFGQALVRVGRTNQVMSSTEQRDRLSGDQTELRLVTRVHDYRFAGGPNFPALIATLSVENTGGRNTFVDRFEIDAEVPFRGSAVGYEFRDAQVEPLRRDLPMNIPAHGVSEKIKVIATFASGFGDEGRAFILRITAVGPAEYERVYTMLEGKVSSAPATL